MGKIICLVGKSAAGKDTLYSLILSRCGGRFLPVIPYTTRPKREDETEGVQYHFVSEKQLDEMERDGRVIEKREYSTTRGIWRYFTLRWEQDPQKDYLLITTPDGVQALTSCYGADQIRTVLLTADGRTLLLRAIDREAQQHPPNYAEVCRRFLADENDFSEDRISKLGKFYSIDTTKDEEHMFRQWEDICRRF